MVEHLRKRLSEIEFITQTYHEWKDEKEKFTTYLHKRVDEINKDRAVDSTSNDRRQEVLKPTSSFDSRKRTSKRKKQKQEMETDEN